MKQKNVISISLLTVACFAGCVNTANKSATNAVFDESTMDLSVNPGDDFYQYANGNWMKNNPLPDDKARFGAFDLLDDENQKKLKALVLKLSESEWPNGSVEQKIGDMYTSGMDTLTIEKEGYEPIKPLLTDIENLQSKGDLPVLIAKLHKIGINAFFNFTQSADQQNSTMNIAFYWQGGLGMPDRDYYTRTDEQAVGIRNAYQQHLAKMFELIGNDNGSAVKKAGLVYDIENTLANASMTRLELRDPKKTLNKYDLEKISKLISNCSQPEYLTELSVSLDKNINVGQPEFFATLNSLIANVSLDAIKAYLQWNVLNSTANYLSSAFENQDFDFYGRTMKGQKIMKPRWERVVDQIDSYLGEALGQIYVKTYFPPKAKERMDDLVKNLRISLSQRIDMLDWMSDTTKRAAHEKLDAIKVKIGYPDKWRDYSAVNIKKQSYVLNVLAGRANEVAFDLAKINQPVDPMEWHMTPQTVNAYYNPSSNEIVFPAGILQPPFFYLDGDDAVNYGAIGVVIGHEITHGFDDKGRLYDQVGNLKDWWQPSDAERFTDRAKVLVSIFNNFTVIDSVKANGELTLGENIADLGGLNISYQAFHNSLVGKGEPEKIDGFTADQRFYLAYARVWAQNIRDKEILRRTQEDVHSLGKWRVNGPLPNIPEFHKAFGIGETDKMFLPDTVRAKIW